MVPGRVPPQICFEMLPYRPGEGHPQGGPRVSPSPRLQHAQKAKETKTLFSFTSSIQTDHNEYHYNIDS